MSNVSILPQGASITTSSSLEDESQATKTFKAKNLKIIGECDDKEALIQSIYFMLGTQKKKYLIYPRSYGILLDVVGMDEDIAKSEVKRRVTETLKQDDRINDVGNFEFEIDEDSMYITCTVFSIYGEIDIEKEVKS